MLSTIAISGAAVLVPIAAVADHTTAHTIEQLSAQIAALQAQLLALSGAPAAPAAGAGAKCSFTRALTVGSRGDDVTCLQNYLTGTGHFTYSGGATGYFGGVTKAAVAAWQAANGVSPAVGYFGPISRAKYDSVVAAAPAVPAAPGAPAAPAVSVAVGSGLTVTSPAEQPVATLVPQSASRVPFVKMILTASADGDVTVKNVVVERRGLADDAAFDGILLLDEDGTQIGNSKTLTSEHKATLTDGLVVKAGTSKTVTIAVNSASSLTNQTGQVGRLTVLSIDAGTSKVNGTFPIDGNGMTFNNTLTIGSVTMTIGSLDPGAANTKNVGTVGYYAASVKASVGSAEDVDFRQIRFNQAGSAAKSDLKNVVVKAGDKEYPTELSSDGKYYIVKFTEPIKVIKGGNIDLSVKIDVVDGSGRTFDFDILKKADIVVQGRLYGYHIVVGGGSSGTAGAGAFSSNQEPFFNAYAGTIDKGSVLLSSSNKIASGNIPVEVSDIEIGALTFDVKGEPIQFTAIDLNFTFTGNGTSTDVTSVSLYDSKGGIVAGPKDPASGKVAWTDTWTAPVGANVYIVKAKLDSSFVADDTIRVGVNPSNTTAKGTITGLTISATPASTLVQANGQTVKPAALKVSVNDTPFAQNVVKGVNGYHFATYIFDAVASGEDVRVTSIQLRDTASANGVFDELNSCILYDGATQLNSGSDVVNPDDPSTGTTDDTTFTLTTNLVVPKGTIKKVDLKCNISSSATANSTHSWGTNAGASNIGSSGAKTGVSITESITTGTGSLMTIKSAGSFSVTKDGATPSAALVLSGKTDVPMLALKYSAVDEAVNITDVTLTFASTTASSSDFTKVSLWDGATKIGEAVWAGTAQFATSTLSAPFVVPKDGDKILTVKADVGTISVTASTTAGRILSINYDTNSSSTGTGVSSGARLGQASGPSVQGNGMQIMKSIPTIEKIAVPSTTLPQTAAVMYRFKVTADAAGPIALYKFTFLVSSSTVSATSSNFNVYGYTDSGFSVKAYDNNPLHSSNVDCAGSSNLDNDTNGCNVATTAVTSTASNTPAAPSTAGGGTGEVVWFFGPVANLASTTEAIVVPAGATRYFELRGDITNPGSGTGNSITVQLEGDAARPAHVANPSTTADQALGNTGCHDSGRGKLCTAATVALGIDSGNAAIHNDFVWSAMSTSTTISTATSTTDWTNGFLVPGLPSTNLSSNVFSN